MATNEGVKEMKNIYQAAEGNSKSKVTSFVLLFPSFIYY